MICLTKMKSKDGEYDYDDLKGILSMDEIVGSYLYISQIYFGVTSENDSLMIWKSKYRLYYEYDRTHMCMDYALCWLMLIYVYVGDYVINSYA